MEFAQVLADSFGMGDGAAVGVVALLVFGAYVLVCLWLESVCERWVAMSVEGSKWNAGPEVGPAAKKTGDCGVCCGDCGNDVPAATLQIQGVYGDAPGELLKPIPYVVRESTFQNAVNADPRTRWQKLAGRIWPAVHAVRPDVSFEPKDCVTVRYRVALSAWDLIKLLFSWRIEFHVRTVTDAKIGNLKSAVAAEVLPPSFVRKSPNLPSYKG